MKSIEELKAIKAKNRGDMSVRDAKGAPVINVHMGTCGIANGAREVLIAVMDEIKTRNLTNVHVTQSGCPGMCVEEPLITLTIPGEKPYIYRKVSPENAKAIVTRHVVNKQPVKEWLLNLEN
ncbi:MAG: (2Fe-2S) ferredoxin domain-containing protein [Peptococcaceae bacterium]|jgi:NADP-reducing hydrogenase subunit HndB|nr:(2Fe-2S) ferredoxin domain-containing protein [Peptococcaceae bacterium]